jgi:uncharacterized protein
MDVNLLFNLAFQDDPAGIAAAVGAGHDPNCIHPRGGHTPLQVASESGSAKAAKALLSAGADPNFRFRWESRVDGRCFEGRVALMYSSSDEVARVLVAAGADVNAVDSSGWSPLALAVEAVESGVFRYLLSAGASTKLRLNGRAVSIEELIDEKVEHLRKIGGAKPTSRLESMLSALDVMLGEASKEK